MEEARVESLPCALSPEEVRQRGEAVARLLKERDDLDFETKQYAKQRREELGELELAIARLAIQIRERQEYRPVEVACLRNPSDATVVWVRKDTGEVVRQRPMTEEEKQERLPFPDALAREALDEDTEH
jgi:hypothetical protein